ncbi:MAG: LptA/OstA family protein [Candidatus Omnitrophota bacterium]
MENRTKRALIGVFVLGGLVIFCAEDGADANDTKPGSMSHKVSSFNLEGYSDKGIKQWEVTGESAKMEGGGVVKMSNIVANTFSGEAKTTITAESGEYDKTKSVVKLNENVSATIAYSKEAAGDYAKMDLGLSGPKREGADKNGSSDEKMKTEITCDGEVEFNYEKNIIHFKDKVSVWSPDGKIRADTITVYIGSKTKEIDQIVAVGNVEIERDNNITYSEKATYIQAQKKIVLSGKPKLVFYQDSDFTKNIFE